MAHGMARCKFIWEDEEDPQTAFIPTPAEIAAGCLLIQAEWSEDERARRTRRRGDGLPDEEIFTRTYRLGRRNENR